ncbi:GPP34 family phosphoprotein [Flammeovirga sp. MY04]|uniref:GOLPH3/VPS74 family protein n=1 Tax=Flammeovirga sp. MY04 TaxID=1191459 RepID=UPI00080609E2|nr:GPP34 family phosphoprotein [Flammeovirga sp. MY04]ANQ51668.1 GPP34 family phosphoprotein [Flammeovirga sp. MY04]
MNQINLNTLDQLILLSLDDDKGTFVHEYSVFGYCLAGAALYDLTLKERINISEGRINVIHQEETGDEALDECLKLISKSKKARKINYWIDKLGYKESDLKGSTLNKLLDLQILEKREDKILWLFTYNKYPTKNEVPEVLIRKRLNAIIHGDQQPMANDIMIISLVNSCGLNKEVYGKEVAKEKKKTIQKLIKEFEFANETSQVIKEIHDLIIASLALVVIMPTMTASSS